MIKCYTASTISEVANMENVNTIEELQTLIDNDTYFDQCGDFEQTCGDLLFVEFEIDGVDYEIVDGILVKKKND